MMRVLTEVITGSVDEELEDLKCVLCSFDLIDILNLLDASEGLVSLGGVFQ